VYDGRNDQGAGMSDSRIPTVSARRKSHLHPHLQKIDSTAVKNAKLLNAINALKQAADEMERRNKVMALARDRLQRHEIEQIWEENSSSMLGRHAHRIPL